MQIKVVKNLPKATAVSVEPCTEDDWEILELNSELAEDSILKQVYDLLNIFISIRVIAFFFYDVQIH